MTFLTFKLSESLWNRCKTILLDQELNLEKNPIEKVHFFLVEKEISKKGTFFLLDFPIVNDYGYKRNDDEVTLKKS